MKTVTLFLLGLALSASAVADPARLALWVTDSIGATSGTQCNLQTSSTSAPSLPAGEPTLTENDVTAWDAEKASWTLSSARFSDAAQKLQDRCFVLAIDGKLVSSGVVLSSHSARLTQFPTLSVYSRDHSLELRLTSGNRGSHSSLIHVDELNDVLGCRANRPEAVYDDKGRVIRKANEAGVVSEYTYHPQSGKLLLVQSKDLKTEFKYDGQGNLIHAANSNGQTIDLDYGSVQLIQRMVEVNLAEKSRRELKFKYNAEGHPIEIILEGTGKIDVEYDDKGEISKVSSSQGMRMALQVTLAFQNLLSVVKVAGVRF